MEQAQHDSLPSSRTRLEWSIHDLLVIGGRVQTVAEWSAETGIELVVLRRRLNSGRTPEEAVTPWRLPRVPLGLSLPAGTPGAASWDVLEWEHDPYAQRLVAERGALTLEEVGAVLGITREAVRQLEDRALEKYRIAQRLVRLLGWKRGARLIEALRGETVPAYREQLRAVERKRGTPP